MSVVRYVTASSGALGTVSGTGKNYQHLVVPVTISAQIAANANANIFQWSGGAPIKDWWVSSIRAANGVAFVTAYTVTLAADGKTINIAVPNGATALVANSIVYLELLIGAY